MFNFRPFQEKAIRALDCECHVICVAQTGAGKSLIYETLAIKNDLKILLVSPLMALARQQARRLKEKGIRLYDPKTDRTKSGVWILSPESILFQDSFIRLWKPDLLVVDECHCLWEWGESFRPAFSGLPELIRTYSIPKSLWLTATLRFANRRNLLSRLPKPIIEIGEFSLPSSLVIQVEKIPWELRIESMVAFVSNQKEPGLIFVPTRGLSERLSRVLSFSGKRSLYYHAGLGREERLLLEKQIHEKWPDVIVATSAFGMGMDYHHLRWVLLWQAPFSLQAMAQAIGRVGRDNKRAYAWVYWDEQDFKTMEWSTNHLKQDYIAVKDFLTTQSCRKLNLDNYFQNSNSPKSCLSCDICLRKFAA